VGGAWALAGAQRVPPASAFSESCFPTRIDALLTRARQVADGRVVAGVHYASDAEAGIASGDLLFTELENKPEFENDLATALTKDQISLK
jgi:hypothetical protein